MGFAPVREKGGWAIILIEGWWGWEAVFFYGGLVGVGSGIFFIEGWWGVGSGIF